MFIPTSYIARREEIAQRLARRLIDDDVIREAAYHKACKAFRDTSGEIPDSDSSVIKIGFRNHIRSLVEIYVYQVGPWGSIRHLEGIERVFDILSSDADLGVHLDELAKTMTGDDGYKDQDVPGHAWFWEVREYEWHTIHAMIIQLI